MEGAAETKFGTKIP